nr:unnamed protein product [Callosobruchus analis]
MVHDIQPLPLSLVVE